MRLLLNILWFVFGGWISLLAWLLAGLILACTLVGLPWAFAAFRLAGFSAAPFGRQVLPRSAVDGDSGSGALDGLLNVIWFLFAGWWLALHHLVLAILLICSIIGIPFGLQHLKLAGLSLAPVGTRVVET
jgi:uncharacterized membrane protein YccF (DUF307 family)